MDDLETILSEYKKGLIAILDSYTSFDPRYGNNPIIVITPNFQQELENYKGFAGEPEPEDESLFQETMLSLFDKTKNRFPEKKFEFVYKENLKKAIITVADSGFYYSNEFDLWLDEITSILSDDYYMRLDFICPTNKEIV
jgi:hypothetical protein